MDTTIKLRVGTDEVANWKLRAKATNLTLSAWIRLKCSEWTLEERPPLAKAHELIKTQLMKEAVTHPDNPGAKFYHTAASHRHTCLCPSCSNYRERNAIPLGGFTK